MKRLLKIHADDSVAVALEDLAKGTTEDGLCLLADIPFGHKAAVCHVKAGERVIKYGYPIGIATQDIPAGAWVHSHNMKTALSDIIEYTYAPSPETVRPVLPEERFFEGYRRTDGRVGIRNEIWILPTVGCVNKTAEQLAQKAGTLFGACCDGFFAYTHPYGCSQLGDDEGFTQAILAGLAKHPNTAGVLLLSLGCENNHLDVFLPKLGEYDKNRIRTLVTQDAGDELAEGMETLGQLALLAKQDKRERVPLSELVVGLKCGGSDAFSGITANPLCGCFADGLTALGGSIVLTEVPEMFGAETILMNRAADGRIFNETVGMINSFKNYYKRYNQVIYENPSPGNKKGGITTLEEKSLGCIQKGGKAAVRGVLSYGGALNKKGLNLLSGPGNDIVSTTALAASGAHMILFTTGRGTPLGAPVPTIKIATNTGLFERKPNWIDYNAGELLEHFDFARLTRDLWTLVLDTANGRTTKNEENDYREIAIFKDGVTL
ncbi:MAG: altronate dehydratase family protein [Oscillospiraceae bacterium]|jgi:altronate hydrolase|nr:altronate dehydratase family protein [Oscillospiraceae bacterium]